MVIRDEQAASIAYCARGRDARGWRGIVERGLRLRSHGTPRALRCQGGRVRAPQSGDNRPQSQAENSQTVGDRRRDLDVAVVAQRARLDRTIRFVPSIGQQRADGLEHFQAR